MVFQNLNIITLVILALVVGAVILASYFREKTFARAFYSRLVNFKTFFSLFWVRLGIMFLVLLFLSLGILRPKWGGKTIEMSSSGVDVVFVLDVSESMNSLDLSDSASRLELSKDMIARFVSEHKQNRYSLIIFAGEAFVSTPLTSDSDAFLTFLNSVTTDSVLSGGTDILEALKMSIERFTTAGSEDRGRAIVLISDGGEEIKSDYSEFSKFLRENAVAFISVGVGSKNGGKIPIGRDMFGRIAYKKYKGEDVITKLNEKGLKTLTSAFDGRYIRIKSGDEFGVVGDVLANLKTTVITTDQNLNSLEDRFQVFVFFALGFFSLWLCLDILPVGVYNGFHEFLNSILTKLNLKDRWNLREIFLTTFQKFKK